MFSWLPPRFIKASNVKCFLCPSMISYVLREWQIHLSEETLSKRFCSGCAEIAFMQHGGQNLEIELVIDFAYFAFVARGKIRFVTVLSSIQILCRIFLCHFCLTLVLPELSIWSHLHMSYRWQSTCLYHLFNLLAVLCSLRICVTFSYSESPYLLMLVYSRISISV